jgi:hypothetical protein
LQRQHEGRDASTVVCRRCGSELPRVHSKLPVVLVPAESLESACRPEPDLLL